MKLFDTSRGYSEREEEVRQSLKIAGYKITVVAKDFWVGPWKAGQEGYWQKGIFIDEG